MNPSNLHKLPSQDELITTLHPISNRSLSKKLGCAFF